MKYVYLLSLPLWIASVSMAEHPTPFSDPDNIGGWILNEAVSDEFEGEALDEKKWLIQGAHGEYKSRWIGRAPSQFSTNNVSVEDGLLKIWTRWDTNFPFSDKIDDGRKYENITTAAVITREPFLHGYMEIKCKAADASITSSFWGTGHHQELDVFEFIGKPKQTHKKHLETEMMYTLIDWSTGKNKQMWRGIHELPWRIADDFHVYGCEWDDNQMRFFADGELVGEVTKEELGEKWVLNNPLYVWVDSETFPWHGIPVAEDLPVSFDVEYVRVWQKPNDNLLDRAFFGFEGPFKTDHSDEGPGKDWYIPEQSTSHFSLSNENYAGGVRSLRFEHRGATTESRLSAMSPYQSTTIPAGKHTLSMKVWIKPGSAVRRVHAVLENPWLQLKPFEFAQLPRGEWVTISQTFERETASTDQDRIRVVFGKTDIPSGSSVVYIDDISITPAE